MQRRRPLHRFHSITSPVSCHRFVQSCHLHSMHLARRTSPNCQQRWADSWAELHSICEATWLLPFVGPRPPTSTPLHLCSIALLSHHCTLAAASHVKSLPRPPPPGSILCGSALSPRHLQAKSHLTTVPAATAIGLQAGSLASLTYSSTTTTWPLLSMGDSSF
jgi:hypothetical protein